MKNKVAKNASWIIVCRIVKMICGLVISMFTARFLGPSNFGLINYASSVVSFVLPVMQLGITSIIVQELINNPDEEGKILGTSILLCMFSGLICMGGVVTFALVANAGETETIIVCALYSFMIVAEALEVIIYWFQAHLMSKYSSIVSFFVYLVVSGYRVFLLITGKSVRWFAVSYALDQILIAAALLVIYKKKSGQNLKFSFEWAKKLLAKGRYFIVASMMVAIFAQTDKIMLKLMIGSTATGLYSAAVNGADLTKFVFLAILDSFRPLIFENKKISQDKFKESVRDLYCITTYLALFQCIVTTIFASLIIRILDGAAYMEATSTLRIAVWYLTFCYYGSVRNIWMLAENQQKYLWIVNLSGAIANIVLNLVLIPVIGINGAAIASLCTQFFANVILGFIIKPLRENNRLMLQGLNPTRLVKIAKRILKK